MFQPRSATARYAIDSIVKVNDKVDGGVSDNSIGTAGEYTASSSKSSFLSKFSDDSGREKWIDSSGRQEATSSFDLSPQKSQIPRIQESDENQISEKDGMEPEVSKTSFTRSVHRRKMLRMLRDRSRESDQIWENSFIPRQKQGLVSEKWTQRENTEEDSMLLSSFVNSHDFLAERLARPARSIDNDVSDDPNQAHPAVIPYNFLPLHMGRNDQVDEKCIGRDCGNSVNSKGRERSAKPFRRASSDHSHRGSSWTDDAVTDNRDVGDSRDNEIEKISTTQNPIERKKLKVDN